MKIVTKNISLSELKAMAKESFGNLIKVVVDIDKKIMAVNAELHSDEEAELLEKGSNQSDLWGINIYPDLTGEGFIEFDSMINLRPSQNNRSRGVDNEKIRNKIIKIVNQLVRR